MDILDWIDVGTVAAERDENLTSYFYDAGLSKRLVENPRQFLLLGRKGAGKTAVFRHFERCPADLFAPTDCLVALSLVNYSWRAHALLKNDEKAPTVSQRDSWRFVIAVESIRALSQAVSAADEKPNTALKKAAELLERIFSKPVPSWTDLLGAKLFGLSKVKLPSIGADEASLGEVSFEQLSQDRTLQAELARNLDHLTKHLEDLLKEACGDRRVFLIFDRLDEAWDASSIEDCKRIITGLIHAADHYVTSFKGQIRPIVFLREDIYADLDLNDKNKLKEDCGSTLMWDNESLEKMILARVNFFARAKSQSDRQTLNSLFDRKEMRNRHSPTNYMLRSTFYRPRDVVAYMNKIIEHLKIERAENSQNEDASDAQTLNADAIYAAEAAYSEYLVNEIKDEWKTQLPDIETYLTTFENIATTVFTADTFESEIKRKKPDLDRSAVRAIMRFLFDNSIIGIGVTVGATRQWRYKCVYTTQRYADADQFRVHYGLKRHLGLKDATGVAPAGEE